MAESPKLLPGLFLCILLAALGVVAGGWIGGTLLARGPGFDALASMLGGMLVGGIVGMVAGGALARSTSASGARRASWVAFALLVALIAIAFARRGNREADGTAPAATPREPVAPVAPPADGT